MVDPATIAAGVNAAANVASAVGGFMGGGDEGLSRQDQRYLAHHQLAMAERNEQFQHDLAKMGIRWKVEDAEAAGLHPLAALGVMPSSGGFGANIPVNSGSGNSLGNRLQSMGQNMSRALSVTRTGEERAMAMAELEKIRSETGYMRAMEAEAIKRTALLGAQPGMPSSVQAFRNVDGSISYGYSSEKSQALMSRPMSMMIEDMGSIGSDLWHHGGVIRRFTEDQGIRARTGRGPH